MDGQVFFPRPQEVARHLAGHFHQHTGQGGIHRLLPQNLAGGQRLIARQPDERGILQHGQAVHQRGKAQQFDLIPGLQIRLRAAQLHVQRIGSVLDENFLVALPERDRSLDPITVQGPAAGAKAQQVRNLSGRQFRDGFAARLENLDLFPFGHEQLYALELASLVELRGDHPVHFDLGIHVVRRGRAIDQVRHQHQQRRITDRKHQLRAPVLLKRFSDDPAQAHPLAVFLARQQGGELDRPSLGIRRRPQASHGHHVDDRGKIARTAETGDFQPLTGLEAELIGPRNIEVDAARGVLQKLRVALRFGKGDGANHLHRIPPGCF